MSNRVLIVLTSNKELGQSGKPTGFYWEELTDPYYAFIDSGFEVDLVSIAGGEPPADPGSLYAEDKRPDSVKRFLADDAALEKLKTTPSIDKPDHTNYTGIFLAGGHGTMWDFSTSEALDKLLGKFSDNNKVIGAVCHGPSGLLKAKRANGESIIANKRITGFSNEEEKMTTLDSIVPFLLEDELSALGNYESGKRFKPFSVVDGNVITGQNPASSHITAVNMVEVLKQQ